MADVRSLLRNERASRRIQHTYASYSSAGTLICILCRTSLKSESLWEGHLKSQQHLMGLQRVRDGTEQDPAQSAASHGKKRKADEEGGTLKKRSRADGVPEGFFDEGVETAEPMEQTVSTPQKVQIPSRPATPATLKTVEPTAPKVADVDEDEWAAFEADIAAAEAPVASEAIISAPAMSAAELAEKAEKETNAQRKERQEAELEGDKEDAARKLEDEFEEMEGLEARVRKLREKREAIRLKEAAPSIAPPQTAEHAVPMEDMDINSGEEDDEEEDDDWDSFRLRS